MLLLQHKGIVVGAMPSTVGFKLWVERISFKKPVVAKV